MYKYARKLNCTHKCTNAVNNVQPIRNSSHMAKILSVYKRLQAGDYENGNAGKRRVSRLTQFIHATLQFANTKGSEPELASFGRMMEKLFFQGKNCLGTKLFLAPKLITLSEGY